MTCRCNPLKCASMQVVLLACVGAGAAALHLSGADRQRAMINEFLRRPAAAEPAREAAVPPGPGRPPEPGATAPRPTEVGGESGAADAPVEGGSPDGASPAPFDLASLGESITVEQAWYIYDTLPFLDDAEPVQVVFVDAREKEHFVKGRIPDSYHITPKSFFDNTLPADMEFWPKDAVIVVYCTGGDCESSHLVRSRLIHEKQFTRVYVMAAGLPGWIEAQLPVEGSN